MGSMVGYRAMLRRAVLLVCSLFLLHLYALAATRRALIVGINRYQQPEGGQVVLWTPTPLRPQPVTGTFRLLPVQNLRGAEADALDMRKLLVETYGFQPEDIQLVLNERATADAILTALKSLIDKSEPGDIRLFYFSGHGSQIPNKSTEKPNGLDVTMIPADYFRGVPAIRDKELARIYRQVPKGVSLTVIQDNCYSGGGARGGPALATRDLAADPRTVDDPPDRDPKTKALLPYPDQQENAVLVLAASQADEPAVEKYMEPVSSFRGTFTYALVEALRETPTERIETVFRKVRAKMQSAQQPVLVGRGRFEKDLLGREAVPLSSIAASVMKVEGRRVDLRGGVSSGIRVGCELRKVWPGDQAHAPLRLKVTNTRDVDFATAEIVGDYAAGDVAERDLFRIYASPAGSDPLLIFYLPPKSLPVAAIEEIGQQVRKQVAEAGLVWVTDPTSQLPDWTLRWNGQSWELYGKKLNGEAVDLGSAPADGVRARLAGARGEQFLFEAPPPETLLQGLELGTGDTAALGVIREHPASADYVLSGVLGDKDLRYAWRRPDLSAGEISQRFERARKEGASLVPWKLALPLMSESTVLSEKTGAVLTEGARRLARPAGWLSLSAPMAADPAFPYELVLKNAQTSEEVRNSDLRNGERYKLVLRATPEAIERAVKDLGKDKDPEKFVYVGAIDSSGQGILLYPEAGQRNKLPHAEQKNGKWELPAEFPLTRADYDLEVAAPFGIDHYYMLISTTPLSTPEVLEFQGAYQPDVESRRGAGDEDPLTRLLRTAGDTRGAKGAESPGNWAIQHYFLRSVAK